MDLCNHDTGKIYEDAIPVLYARSQIRWVCKLCGVEGVDRLPYTSSTDDYNTIRSRFNSHRYLQEQVIHMILEERNRQTELWGDVHYTDLNHAICILGEEFGELCEAINETKDYNSRRPERGGEDNIIKEAIQIAAVAVKLVEGVVNGKTPC